MQKSDIKKLHLGCGDVVIPGFYNMDVQDAPHIDHRGMVQDLAFISDDSVELIYCSHVLEHLGRSETHDALAEWHRVLAPGGVLRLAVPDFAACAEIYREAALTDGLNDLIGLICGGQRNDDDYHKMIFDEALLTSLLNRAGFRSVRRWDWRATEHAHIDDYSQAYLPHMDKENGKLMSLNLEATK